MAAPGIDPRFATDATYTVDGDDWGGAATKIAPGAGRTAEGFEPDSLPAEWLNYLLNLFGAWLYWIAGRLGGLTGSGEWTYEAVRNRTQVVPLLSGISDDVSTNWGITGGISTRQWVSGATGKPLMFPLDPLLRTGQVITNFDVILDPGAARSGTDRMSVGLYYVVQPWAAPTTAPVAPTLVGSLAYDDTTGNKQLVSLAVTHTVDKVHNEYFLVVTSGATAGTDRVYGVAMAVDDPGPRNA